MNQLRGHYCCVFFELLLKLCNSIKSSSSSSVCIEITPFHWCNTALPKGYGKPVFIFHVDFTQNFPHFLVLHEISHICHLITTVPKSIPLVVWSRVNWIVSSLLKKNMTVGGILCTLGSGIPDNPTIDEGTQKGSKCRVWKVHDFT